MSFLDGKKTYIITAILALVCLAEGVLGWDIPGVTLSDDWLAFLLGSLGLGTLRAAIPPKV